MESLSSHYIKRYEPFWGSWKLEKFLGEGNYGKVYKISKKEWGDFKLESALKIVSVPSKEQYREAVSMTGDNAERLESYFKSIINNIINEVKLLYKLRGNSNIVCYEDYKVEKAEKNIGWDILIRMEYVEPLTGIISAGLLKNEDIVRLGKDICSALASCSRHGIIHRDIKEENIFISRDGNFKLGDFGIAREMSNCGGAATMRGTPLYLAPEALKDGRYDERSDIYSLGLVMYKLMNHGRYPFMQPYPKEFSYADYEKGLLKRLSGEKFPKPACHIEGLAEIIMKACSFNPDERYSCAEDMRKAIEECKGVKGEYDDVWFFNLDSGLLTAEKNKAVNPENIGRIKQAQTSKESDCIRIEGDWIYL